jgi:integrase
VRRGGSADDAYLIVRIGGDAGMRCGEMMALEWGDVDLQKRQIKWWRRRESFSNMVLKTKELTRFHILLNHSNGRINTRNTHADSGQPSRALVPQLDNGERAQARTPRPVPPLA